MALIGFKAEKMSRDGFSYKEGDYLAQIQGFESGVSSTGKDFWRVTFRGEGFGRISLNMYDTAFGREDMFKLYEACGIDTERDDVDTDELEGRYVTISIKKQRYNDKDSFVVKDIQEVVVEGSDEDDDDWDM